MQRLRGGRGLTGEGIEVGQRGEVHTEKHIVRYNTKDVYSVEPHTQWS